MDLLRYARSLRRHWRLLLLTTVLGLGVGVASSTLQPAQATSSWYRAEHTLLCSGGSANFAQLTAFTTTGPVPEKAAERLGGNPALLSEQVRAKAVPEANLLQILAVDTDPTRAEQLADTFAEELTAYELQLPDPAIDQRVAQLRTEQEQQRDRWTAALDSGANAATLDEAEFYKAEHDEALQRYDAIEAEIQGLETGGNREACLSTVSTAEAIPATRETVNELLSTPSAGKTSKTAAAGSILPDVNATPSTLGPVPRGAAGAVAGLLLGIALGLLIDRIDPRVRNKEQAEDAFGWPVVAEIPPLERGKRKEVVITTHEQPRSRIAEAYRVLRSAILFAADVPESFAADPSSTTKGNGSAKGNRSSTPDARADAGTRDADKDAASTSADAAGEADPGDMATETGRTLTTAGRRKGNRRDQDERAPGTTTGKAETSVGPDADTGEGPPATRNALVVMVTSPGPAEGKTTSVANLAAAFAEANAKVLVVNCDFRRPRVHSYLGGDQEKAARGPEPTDYPNIDLFDHHSDALEESPAEILAEQRRMIRRARSRYDVIVLDTAPLLSTNDATEVLNEADLIVLVGKAGKTTKEAADRAAELLDRREAPVLGVVLVGVTEGPGGRYYYYGSNRYYSDESRRDAAGANPLEAIATADAAR